MENCFHGRVQSENTQNLTQQEGTEHVPHPCLLMLGKHHLASLTARAKQEKVRKNCRYSPRTCERRRKSGGDHQHHEAVACASGGIVLMNASLQG
eukprot:4503840-Pleurochrysis_carterae.AAC.2